MHQSRSYLTHGLRYRTMTLATAWLGLVPQPERTAHQDRARDLDHAMDAQVHEAKKEDSMDDQDQDALPREIDPQPTVPEPAPSAPASDAPTLLQRLQALLQRVPHAQDREQGMGL